MQIELLKEIGDTTMTHEDGMPDDHDLGLLHSHFSRLYNSAVSILTSIIIGWAAFVGFALNAISTRQPYLQEQIPFPVTFTGRHIILLIGIVIVIVGGFDVYFRVLHFGRMLWKLENALGLRPYLKDLRKLRIIDMMTERRGDLYEWTIGEIGASVILVFYFGIPLWLFFSL